MKSKSITLAVDLSELDDLRPENGQKFSPNLYRWLCIQRPRAGTRLCSIYGDAEGRFFIGCSDAHSLFGSQLNDVLCNGAKAGRWAFSMEGKVLVPDFWDRYRSVGRCAIDQSHTNYFIADEGRWLVDGDSRSCTWCGTFNQTMRRWTETVEKSAWEVAAAP